MTATIVIPARWGSSRLPGKPLILIAGRPLIYRTWEAASRTGLRTIVATDDERIADVARLFGAETVLTPEAKNGTERCAHVARQLGLRGPVVNWQGDSPLVPPEWIPALLDRLDRDDYAVATPVQTCTDDQASTLRFAYAAGVPTGTFAVVDDMWQAAYFSKCPVPSRGPWLLHVGIYAYRTDALLAYGTEETPLERSEQLEQLRFIERGIPIAAVPLGGEPIWEVNQREDVSLVSWIWGERNGAVRA